MDKKKTALLIVAFLIVGIIGGWSATGFVTAKEVQIQPVTNRDYFPVLQNELQSAKNKIRVVMFEIKYYEKNKDSEINAILQDLINAKRRGVDVRLLMEGGEGFLGNDFSKETRQVCDFLKNGGVDVRFDKNGTTTHSKLIIADGKVLIGSTNWGYSAFSKNNEANVLITSQDTTSYFESYFNKLWDEGREC